MSCSLREAFKDGEIPAELLANRLPPSQGLEGEWILTQDSRSDGMREITAFFGLDPKNRTAWEFSQHLNAPRIRLEYKLNENKMPVLKVVCHGSLSADCPRSILFDGIAKSGIHIDRIVPHSRSLHMPLSVEEGTFLAAEIDGILFVKYQVEKGTFYMTRVLLKEDPEGKAPGCITLAQYCVVQSDGEKHVARRYHERLNPQP